MFDFGWSELAVIAVVALVVIGPKDLPRVLRTAGYWMRRVRSIASEFQSSIEQMAREAELDDLRKQVEEANKAKKEMEDSLVADAAKMASDASRLMDVPSIAPPHLASEAMSSPSDPLHEALLAHEIVPPGEVMPSGTAREPHAELPSPPTDIPQRPPTQQPDATHRG